MDYTQSRIYFQKTTSGTLMTTNIANTLEEKIRQPTSFHQFPWRTCLGIALCTYIIFQWRMWGTTAQTDRFLLAFGLVGKQTNSLIILCPTWYPIIFHNGHHQELPFALGVNSEVLAAVRRLLQTLSKSVFQNYVLSTSSWRWETFLLEINN